MRLCETEGCKAESVGVHRRVGPSDPGVPGFGTTTPWEEACDEHIGKIVVGLNIWTANRVQRYPLPLRGGGS